MRIQSPIKDDSIRDSVYDIMKNFIPLEEDFVYVLRERYHKANALDDVMSMLLY